MAVKNDHHPQQQRLMTKTQHYRKVTKPLLERKRRARMNLYLDELKSLIIENIKTEVNGSEQQPDHVDKLEKADILEMTVAFLRAKRGSRDDIRQQQQPQRRHINAERFRAGYTQASYEVSKIFASSPELDLRFGAQLMRHLKYRFKDTNNTITKAIGGSDYKTVSLFSNRREEVQPQPQPMPMVAFHSDEKSSNFWRPW